MLVSFLAAARDSVFMPKTADPRIVAVGLGYLVPIPDGLACWSDGLGFSSIVAKTVFDPTLTYVVFGRPQGVDWSFFDHNDSFFQ